MNVFCECQTATAWNSSAVKQTYSYSSACGKQACWKHMNTANIMSKYRKTKQVPMSSFEIYISEGDRLFRKGDFGKAIKIYSTALELKPGDKNCLVARSKCYLKLGQAEASLRDAEESLHTDKNSIKVLVH
ncbi:outer dynein arm-docking complex subunit 4-like [Protopterus annectens]|uniref:outer dynein arm-docking complex subunit 4-like n=1 Tax=Protopterus annectens TaxID=7888 RepID=UPI001CFC45B3|nr:outer dynein arm-docking complex subunit 4-like [Protopterus annectens]